MMRSLNDSKGRQHVSSGEAHFKEDLIGKGWGGHQIVMRR